MVSAPACHSCREKRGEAFSKLRFPWKTGTNKCKNVESTPRYWRAEVTQSSKCLHHTKDSNLVDAGF